MREIFRKVPLSEKKAVFKASIESKSAFLAKGEADELVTLILDDYVDGKILTFNYAAKSPKILSNQEVILNFSYGEDRYFLQAHAEVYGNRVHIAANVDVYILQRRKTPRLEIPEQYPGEFNIISHEKKTGMYRTTFKDFSSGGCRVQYVGHIPLFKSGDQIRGVIHLNHRNAVELDGEIKHHSMDKSVGVQIFGVQFKLGTSILESKMLVVFLDLQRELFVKWKADR
jgi:mannuronan synthase